MRKSWNATRSIVATALAGALLAGLARADQKWINTTPAMPGNASAVSVAGAGKTGTADANGNYPLAIPIEVPPGPRGLQPDLAIIYNGGANSWLGVGWHLPTSVITRDGREGIHGDLHGIAVELSGAAAHGFLLDGARLIRQGGTTRFHTELESHQRITYGEVGDATCTVGLPRSAPASDWWLVRDPDGSFAEYEPVAALRPNADGTLENVGTRDWRIARRFDPTGENVIVYRYDADGNPTAIVWGACAGPTDRFNAVTFETAPRDDARTTFAMGARVVAAVKLTEITVSVRTNADGVGIPVRRYVTAWRDDTRQLQLAAIHERPGASATPELVTTFAYWKEGPRLIRDDTFLGSLGTDADGHPVVESLATMALRFWRGPTCPAGMCETNADCTGLGVCSGGICWHGNGGWEGDSGGGDGCPDSGCPLGSFCMLGGCQAF